MVCYRPRSTTPGGRTEEVRKRKDHGRGGVRERRKARTTWKGRGEAKSFVRRLAVFSVIK